MRSNYFLALILPLLTGCWSKDATITLNGYVEGEFRFLSTIETGTVADIKVKKGDFVQKNQILAFIENTDSALSVAKAQSAFNLTKITLERLKVLQQKGAIPKADLDTARSSFDKAKADLDLSQWHLNKDAVKAPEEGYIQNILKYPGEVTSAQNPIIYFLPKTGIKVRFFAPETLLSKLKLNQTIKIKVDGMTNSISAKIQFISNTAEFNPPIIYTNQLREKLLFMVEAVPELPLSLKPGQPVEIKIGQSHEK